MKITKRPTTVSGEKSVSGTRGTGISKLNKPAAGRNVDKLQVATSTAQLQELAAELDKLDISDTAKVAAIKRAIDNGTFEVNSVLVADRLIDTAKEAVRKRPRK